MDHKIKVLLHIFMRHLAYGLPIFMLFESELVLSQGIMEDQADKVKDQADKVVEAYYKKKGFSNESIAHRKLAARTAVSAMEKLQTAISADIRLAQYDKMKTTSVAAEVLNQYRSKKDKIALEYSGIEAVIVYPIDIQTYLTQGPLGDRHI